LSLVISQWSLGREIGRDRGIASGLGISYNQILKNLAASHLLMKKKG
jgi:hypothetical protein